MSSEVKKRDEYEYQIIDKRWRNIWQLTIVMTCSWRRGNRINRLSPPWEIVQVTKIFDGGRYELDADCTLVESNGSSVKLGESHGRNSNRIVSHLDEILAILTPRYVLMCHDKQGHQESRNEARGRITDENSYSTTRTMTKVFIQVEEPLSRLVACLRPKI